MNDPFDNSGDMNWQFDVFIDEVVSEQMKQEDFEYASTFWVTKTGREIPLRQMEDEHLKNARTLMEKRPRRLPKATREALEKELARRAEFIARRNKSVK